MKIYSRRTAILKTGAVLSILMILGLTQIPGASWSRLGEVTSNWLATAWHIISDVKVINVVSAVQIQNDLNNPQNWPSSKKHKSFNGGWILPFEIFQQRYHRNDPMSNVKTHYDDMPVEIDLNGDGLLDYIYSKAQRQYESSPSTGVFWRGVRQYIILRRANGFELAYKCYQEYQGTNGYLYRGDCADTAYAGGQPAMEVVWTPVTTLYQNAQFWKKTNPLSTADQISKYIGPKSENSVYDVSYQDYYRNNRIEESEDRYIPKLSDINGDGLPDVVFFGLHDLGASNNSLHNYYNFKFVLYNNGSGFDIEAACVQKPDLYFANPLGPLLPIIPSGTICY